MAQCKLLLEFQGLPIKPGQLGSFDHLDSINKPLVESTRFILVFNNFNGGMSLRIMRALKASNTPEIPIPPKWIDTRVFGRRSFFGGRVSWSTAWLIGGDVILSPLIGGEVILSPLNQSGLILLEKGVLIMTSNQKLGSFNTPYSIFSMLIQ